jgi:hypothetical protein
MVDLQELIVRGRFVFSGAPKRLALFILIDGKKSTKDLARKTGRSLQSVLNDIGKMKDMELIREKKQNNGKTVKKDGTTIYEKVPLVRHISVNYFSGVADTAKLVKKTPKRPTGIRRLPTVHVPSEIEILDICQHGEDQVYEFKAPGTETDKIAKEIAGFLHTRNGGIIFYGVDDDGAIIGADVRRQDFDQKIQNSVQYTISGRPGIEINERKVLRTTILLVIIPPWDRKTIYQYTKDGRYYIRRGTNIFALKPDEIKKLSQGTYVV